MNDLVIKEEILKRNQCRECGENFNDWKELLNHRESTHTLYTCMYCTKDEASLVDFEYHLQLHGGYKLFKCIICQDTFFFLAELNNHLPSHLSKNKNSKEDTGDTYEESSDKTSENQDMELKYKDCQKDENYLEDSHENTLDEMPGEHYNEEEVENKSVLLPKNGKEKKKRGRPAKQKIPYSMLERKFKCPHCPLSVKTSTNLKHHLRTHSGDRPYECALCGKSYVQKIALKIHLTMKHDPNKKKTEVCQFCGKTFYFVRRLKNHIREIHTNRERHPCFICGKTYSAKNSVAIHMQSHFKKADGHPCPKCDRKYDTHVRMMQHHRQAHVNAKQYKCKWEDCEYSTFCPTMLRKHERTHTGEKPYQCKICNKAFSSTTSVNVHISHKHGVPTHQCKLCEKSFKVQDSLKKHMQRIHEERKFPCLACKKKFASNSDAMRHMRDSHSLGKKIKIKE